MSGRSTVGRASRNRPLVVVFGLLVVLQVLLLHNSIQDGGIDQISMGLGGVYAAVVLLLAALFEASMTHVTGLAFTGGMTGFAAVAYASAPASQYAGAVVIFTLGSLYCGWQGYRARTSCVHSHS
ncbi:hypothetical protein SAMN04487967_2956 [Natronorubrum sediminis]|uniref:Uncharacterized protein n=1 Tax=Natronorubrum sediminis TaxID=640943 RepID=A0A1H6G1V2_9EURY|nr:hypothetical protein [Natronorubrum sediminis]SEH17066.1 hypothetical protein SAMN04487967_2956 [Natronorubrum sediminis]